VKYSVVTFGCRVNQADSLGFEEELQAAGAIAAPAEQADLVIVNTCSVTASADQGARQTIRRVARANPAARIVVTGCYATRRPEEIRELPNVVRVIRNSDKARFIEAIDDLGMTSAQRFGDGAGSCGATIEPGLAGRTAFTLRVQTGCAEPCTYCIIPTTRGLPVSVPAQRIVAEIRRVAAAGFKECALTGVHLGSYGHDLDPASSLLQLLLAVAGHAPDEMRFRISSLEPMDCGSEVVSLVATTDVFAHHFHLPLQHASDKILEAMRRPYTRARYQGLVENIRRQLPDASIGTDVIVGFPGETAADFAELADYLESSPLTHVHVFPYSDRPGTAASTLPGKVAGTAIRERARQIRDISGRLNASFLAAQVGRVHRGLTLDDGTLVVTGNYLKVKIPSGHARNQWLRVRVTGREPTLTGEVVESRGAPPHTPARSIAGPTPQPSPSV
jgi:threonylcarbamoyladenosine tRNA methylthiotransferase MtaB